MHLKQSQQDENLPTNVITYNFPSSLIDGHCPFLLWLLMGSLHLELPSQAKALWSINIQRTQLWPSDIFPLRLCLLLQLQDTSLCSLCSILTNENPFLEVPFLRAPVSLFSSTLPCNFSFQITSFTLNCYLKSDFETLSSFTLCLQVHNWIGYNFARMAYNRRANSLDSQRSSQSWDSMPDRYDWSFGWGCISIPWFIPLLVGCLNVGWKCSRGLLWWNRGKQRQCWGS